MTISITNIEQTVNDIVHETPVVDMHTHLFPPSFGSILLWGIDELLTYHYLVAEVMRVAPIPYAQYWSMSKIAQADYIWKHLFIERAPISEACRGVVTCIQSLGFDPSERDLESIRDYFREQTVDQYIETVFQKANVSYAVMTNDPFDPVEREVWDTIGSNHPRFQAALRMDPLLMDWSVACSTLRRMGYDVGSDFTDSSAKEVRRFLGDWSDRINPRYLAVSLPPSFTYPDDSIRTRILKTCVLPFAQERNLPFATMIGVKKLLNPELQLAGDSVGRTDLSCIENLCLKHPDNRFLVTMLSRENQHELCIIARKFGNMLPFGCWWYMNNPSIIEEITRERLELLGWSFVPQHSDARVLDQLLYKWPHSRRIIADVLTDKYTDILISGWSVTADEIKRDVTRLFGRNFESFAS
jgi:hypothetical protein